MVNNGGHVVGAHYTKGTIKKDERYDYRNGIDDIGKWQKAR